MKYFIVSLLFFPVTVFACSDTGIVMPTCTVLTDSQIIQESQDYASTVASHRTGSPVNFTDEMSLNSSNTAITQMQEFLQQQYDMEFSSETLNNSSCQSYWDTYNKQVSDYDACITSYEAQIAPTNTTISTQPTPIITPTPVTSTPIVPIPTIVPPAIQTEIVIPTPAQSIDKVFSGVPQKQKPQVKSDNTTISQPVTSSTLNSNLNNDYQHYLKVIGDSSQSTETPTSTQSVQPVQQPSHNIFVRFWNFIKSLF